MNDNNLAQKIIGLKKKKNAVILSHNYEPNEVQDIADFVGDSLELSIKASKIKEDLIVFCGVYFMAETAKIISPSKKVIMPDKNAGCPMADMLKVENLKALKNQNPKAKVVCYVNSSAEAKSESDICCTSSNSVAVVNSIAEDEIIFVPDKFLGQYTANFCRNKKFILANGFCPTHMRIMPEDILKQKELHPKALVMVHPECRPEVDALADKVLSTGGMVRFVKTSDAKEFIIGTEIGLIHKLEKEYPNKLFYPATTKAVCPNMKLTTLEKILWALEEEKDEIQVPKIIADKARSSIEKMLTIGKQD